MPRKEKSGPRATGNRSNTLQGANDTPKVQACTEQRNYFPRQLPIVRSATAYPPAWGTVTTLIVLDQPCDCGDWHNHKLRGVTPALLARKARCGTKYELALHAPKVSRRGRRAA